MAGWNCLFSSVLDFAVRMDGAKYMMGGRSGLQTGWWGFICLSPDCVIPFFPLVLQNSLVRMQLAIHAWVKISAEGGLGLSFISSSEAISNGSERLTFLLKLTQRSPFLCLPSPMTAAYHLFRSVQASIHWVTLHPFELTFVRQPIFAYLRE